MEWAAAPSKPPSLLCCCGGRAGLLAHIGREGHPWAGGWAAQPPAHIASPAAFKTGQQTKSHPSRSRKYSALSHHRRSSPRRDGFWRRAAGCPLCAFNHRVGVTLSLFFFLLLLLLYKKERINRLTSNFHLMNTKGKSYNDLHKNM